MSRTPALRDHIATLIIERATALFAERGDQISIAEVAEAAGVGRATFYRYFANREALLAGIAAAALEEIRARLADAHLDAVAPSEALARLTRTFLGVGGKFVVLTSTGTKPTGCAEVDAVVLAPIRAVLARGTEQGLLRADLSVDELLMLYGGLLEAGIRIAALPGGGVEHAASAVLDTFLRGASAAER